MTPREQVIALQSEMKQPGWEPVGFKRRVLPIEDAIVGHQPRHHGDYLAGLNAVDVRAYWEAWLVRLLETIQILKDREND